MAEGGAGAGPGPGPSGPTEEVNRSFEGYDEEGDGEGEMGEMMTDGTGRRRMFSKVIRH